MVLNLSIIFVLTCMTWCKLSLGHYSFNVLLVLNSFLIKNQLNINEYLDIDSPKYFKIVSMITSCIYSLRVRNVHWKNEFVHVHVQCLKKEPAYV